jgi:hypothetical protein
MILLAMMKNQFHRIIREWLAAGIRGIIPVYITEINDFMP